MDYKKTAVISGASRGIGFNTAQLLAQQGYSVYDLSRSYKEGPFTHIPCDMKDEASVKAAFDRIEETAGGLDILICNAGYGIAGAIEDTEISQAKEQFAVNFFGACACIKYALPGLRKNRGRLIIVSSLAGVLPLSFQAYYSASKAALNALALALAAEIKPFGISVTAVLPGDAQSDFTAARVKTSVAKSLYGPRAAHSLAIMERDEQAGLSSLYVAKKIAAIAVKKRGKLYYTIGGQYKLFYLLQKLLPLALTRFIVDKIYAK